MSSPEPISPSHPPAPASQPASSSTPDSVPATFIARAPEDEETVEVQVQGPPSASAPHQASFDGHQNAYGNPIMTTPVLIKPPGGRPGEPPLPSGRSGARKGSCVHCRKRKQRCDAGPTPGSPCLPCVRLSRVCVYPPGGIHTPRTPGSGKSHKKKENPNPATSFTLPPKAGEMPSVLKGYEGESDESSEDDAGEGTRLPGGMGGMAGYGYSQPGSATSASFAYPKYPSHLGQQGMTPSPVGYPQYPVYGVPGAAAGGKKKREVDFSDSEDDGDEEGGEGENGNGNGKEGRVEDGDVVMADVSSNPNGNGDVKAGSESSSDAGSAGGAPVEGNGNGVPEEEVDELMSGPEDAAAAAAGGVAGKKEKGKEGGGGAGGKRNFSTQQRGELDDEVEGELLMMLAEPAPKVKRKREGSPSRRQSNNAGPAPFNGEIAFAENLPPPPGFRGQGGGGRPKTSSRLHRVESHPYFPGDFAGGPRGMDPNPDRCSYGACLAALLPVLPPPQTQAFLFQQFFADHFLAQGLSMLQNQYNQDFKDLLQRRMGNAPFRDGDATTVAVGFAIMAISLRAMPEETSQMLLSTVPPSTYPRGMALILKGQPPSAKDITPLHRRYMDHALIASQLADMEDPPSIMLVFLKLILYRYANLCAHLPITDKATGNPMLPKVRDKMVLAGSWLAQGVKISQAMGMNREWDGIPVVERELRRRIFWALYVADRSHAFATSFPYTIVDAHTTVDLLSPISDAALAFLPPTARALPPNANDREPTPTAYLHVMAKVSKLITKLLDSFATQTPAGTPSKMVDHYEVVLATHEETWPLYLRPGPKGDASMDMMHPYLPSHRVALQTAVVSIRLTLHRSKLYTYLKTTDVRRGRRTLAELCKAMLKVQRSARMLESKMAQRLFDIERVFEATVISGLILRVDSSLSHQTEIPADEDRFTPEEIASLRASITEGIELLEGVLTWPEVAFFASKSLAVLAALQARLEEYKIRGGRNEAGEVQGDGVGVGQWLDGWKGVNVDMLMAEAEWRDWQRVVEFPLTD